MRVRAITVVPPSKTAGGPICSRSFCPRVPLTSFGMMDCLDFTATFLFLPKSLPESSGSKEVPHEGLGARNWWSGSTCFLYSGLQNTAGKRLASQRGRKGHLASLHILIPM